MSSLIVWSVVKLNCQEHQALTTVSFMKLNPQDHRVLESGLTTLHLTKLGREKVHKLGPNWGLNWAGAPAGPRQCIKWPFITNFPHPLISPPLLIRIISTVFEGCWRIAGMCQLKRLVESGDWVGNLCVLSSKFQCNICQCLNLPLTCVDVFKVCKLSIPWKLIW
jgi:hypothetical protein